MLFSILADVLALEGTSVIFPEPNSTPTTCLHHTVTYLKLRQLKPTSPPLSHSYVSPPLSTSDFNLYSRFFSPSSFLSLNISSHTHPSPNHASMFSAPLFLPGLCPIPRGINPLLYLSPQGAEPFRDTLRRRGRQRE